MPDDHQRGSDGIRASQGIRVGLDIGGTFTDLVLLDEATGTLQQHKLLTTPDDPADAALRGLDALLAKAGKRMADLDAVLHGTTIVTNAIIERRGRPTGLITTTGFRDVLGMGHEQRYDIYDLFLAFPEPIVPRRWRREIGERVSRDGAILRPLDLNEVDVEIDALVAEGVEAVAIALLHSYRMPDHERRVAARIRERHPQLFVSVSSEVAPEIREYERTNTTVCNAYVQPLMDTYLERIEDRLREGGFAGQFSLMLSSGGIASAETARRFPIRLLESGPAGGALAAAYFAARIGSPDVLSFDMGGTTAKACLIQDGRPDVTAEIEAGRVHRFKRGSGLPIRAPVVDMIEIGAGGGSIAHRDTLGLLKVGPQSASANPGPACYGLGGTEATVTDACLTLGYYDPSFFLGGTMRLDAEASFEVLERLGQQLGLTATEAAWGIFEVVCENMASAARVHIVEKDRDPRDFPLLAFGGAGPAHATRTARILGVKSVLVPPLSGVASAIGFLVAPPSHEVTRSFPGAFDTLPWDAIAEAYHEMEQESLAILATAGSKPEEVRIERSVEARLIGQFHDIEVPLPDLPFDDPRMPEALTLRFEQAYAERYHTVLPGYRAMAVSWRLRAIGLQPEVTFRREPKRAGITVEPKGTRVAYFPEAGAYVDTPVFDRQRLPSGFRHEGPLIIEEAESTTIAAPGDVVEIDDSLNVIVHIALSSRENQRVEEVLA